MALFRLAVDKEISAYASVRRLEDFPLAKANTGNSPADLNVPATGQDTVDASFECNGAVCLILTFILLLPSGQVKDKEVPPTTTTTAGTFPLNTGDCGQPGTGMKRRREDAPKDNLVQEHFCEQKLKLEIPPVADITDVICV
ncbi:hypothetical protein D9758_018650 [Tetrapyrgos nigripes]|uniref:Uncharacterized protein n=1 Tax=Tetrapyrgos nigripes TaxID=182062 RepID=A0A8H5B934_9AGAR|nr:hypothetical protein D9758_018650 [Tetrapyrgos nigripes]